MLSYEEQMCILLGKKLIDASLEYFGKLKTICEQNTTLN